VGSRSKDATLEASLLVLLLLLIVAVVSSFLL
jgi:hypothetical protein